MILGYRWKDNRFDYNDLVIGQLVDSDFWQEVKRKAPILVAGGGADRSLGGESEFFNLFLLI